MNSDAAALRVAAASNKQERSSKPAPRKRAAKRKEPELTYSKSSKKTDDTKEEVPVPVKRRCKNSLSPKKASARILERQNDVAATNETEPATTRAEGETAFVDHEIGSESRPLPHASIRNTMRERRLEVFKICSAPPMKGQLSPIQIATEMDGSVLWGCGKHAVTIADDFERVFASVPSDGPMLQWVQNLISMAQTSYALFNKEYESSSIHESKTQHNPPATSVSTHDTNSNTLQPLQSKFYHAPPLVRLTQGANGRLFVVNKGDEIIESDLDPDTEDMFDPTNVSKDEIDKDHFLELDKPSPPVKPVIGNHRDGTGDATGENNNRGLQSQRPIKTKRRVIKSKLFINDDHYDGNGGINTSGIDSGGIDNGGIDSRGIGNSGINDSGIADGGIADGGIADGGIADGRIDDGGIADGGIDDGRIDDGGIDDSGIDDNGSDDGGIDTGQDDSGEINGSAANMLFKDKRAPSAWTGFQKMFKDMNKKPHDQSLQVWTRDVVALAYNAHRASLDNEGLKKFKDDMIQCCMDNEASKDLTKVLNGGRAKVMDRIGNQLSRQARALEKLNVIVAGYVLCGDPSDSRAVTQNSFFGMPAVVKVFQDMHQDMARHFSDIIVRVYSETHKSSHPDTDLWSEEARDKLRGSNAAICDQGKKVFVDFLRSLLPDGFVPFKRIFVGMGQACLECGVWLVGWPSFQQFPHRQNFKLVKWTDDELYNKSRRNDGSISLVVDTEERTHIRADEIDNWEHHFLRRSEPSQPPSHSRVSMHSHTPAQGNVPVPQKASGRAWATAEEMRRKWLVRTLNKLDAEKVSSKVHKTSQRAAIASVRVPSGHSTDLPALSLPDEVDRVNPLSPTFTVDSYDSSHPPTHANDVTIATTDPSVGNSSRRGLHGPSLWVSAPNEQPAHNLCPPDTSQNAASHGNSSLGPSSYPGPSTTSDSLSSEKYPVSADSDQPTRAHPPLSPNPRNPNHAPPQEDHDGRNSESHVENSGPRLDHDGQNSGPYLQNAGPCLDHDGRNSESHVENSGPRLDHDRQNSGPYLQNARPHLDHDG
ncbi:hypothetical protein BS47DRAFT_1358176 [Hydnum rufescens UP504]|uniref:Uncharacterized protein n=1 Tax=Hydnum rufescens UP504 TaxID=1448309 RepID=A0A9P6E1J2_9AGAM|nr:hypothetical protein BS47DRAFT_1358176 [Hydnum rufescens UP504]